MKSTICLLFIMFFSIGFAQDCDCASDLDFVAAKAKESPSFKSQWKSPLADKFLIAGLKEDMRNDENLALNCLYYLQTYLGAVKDNHIYIADFDKEKDYASLTPFYKGSPEDLSSNAVTTTDDPVTGIYELAGVYRVAVVKVADKYYDYAGYILESNYEDWPVGSLKFTLRITGEDFSGNFYDRNHKPQRRKVDLTNGRLYPERWVKEDFAASYAANNYYIEGDTFQYKDYGNGVHYVRLGSFGGSNENYAKAMKLLETLKEKLTSGKVILDLRNNGGGGPRTSDPFLKLFKKRKKQLEFHLIQNNFVASNAEHFLIKAKNQLPLTTYGENTKGALAYGFGNYSTADLITPCNNYSLGLTSSKYERYLKYEVVGIAPDVSLSHKSDWIGQVLAKIE